MSCSLQPVIQINNPQGSIQLDFAGSCYVQMASSPSGYEPLYVADPTTGSACNAAGYCGKKALGTIASVDFKNGFATFSVSK